MDRGLLGQEAARELLIAISNSQPEKVESDQESDQAESSNGWEAGAVINGDRTELFRSQLISISYPRAPNPPNDGPVCNGHA